jgi:hypothetical protein
MAIVGGQVADSYRQSRRPSGPLPDLITKTMPSEAHLEVRIGNVETVDGGRLDLSIGVLISIGSYSFLLANSPVLGGPGIYPQFPR